MIPVRQTPPVPVDKIKVVATHLDDLVQLAALGDAIVMLGGWEGLLPRRRAWLPSAAAGVERWQSDMPQALRELARLNAQARVSLARVEGAADVPTARIHGV